MDLSEELGARGPADPPWLWEDERRSATAVRPRPAPRRLVRPGAEFRTVPFDVASSQPDGDGLTFEGYAAVYGQSARIAGYAGDFDEQIAPGAFRAITAGKYPVLMFEHGKHPLIGTLPIGRITNARDDQNGLWIEARLTDNWLIQPVRDAIADKAIDGMSFRFTVDDGGESWVERGGQLPLRTLTSVSVPELGPVVFPAYAPTTASVRSALDSIPVIGRPARDHHALASAGAVLPEARMSSQDLPDPEVSGIPLAEVITRYLESQGVDVAQALRDREYAREREKRQAKERVEVAGHVAFQLRKAKRALAFEQDGFTRSAPGFSIAKISEAQQRVSQLDEQLHEACLGDPERITEMKRRAAR